MRAAKGSTDGQLTEKVSVRRRRREISDEHALEVRGDLILRMAEEDGLSVPAIARIMGFSDSSTRKYLAQARARRGDLRPRVPA